MPAGGRASRIAPIPCSKELFPVGFRSVDEDRSLRPKVICHYLLERMRLASVTKVFIILRQGKWDIPAYLGDGSMLGMQLAYLMIDMSDGVPYTIDQAYHFIQDSLVAFGFPDIIFQPDDAFEQLLTKQAATDADIVLGLFPAHQPEKMDMVDLYEDGRIRQVIIKPSQTNLHYTWIIAVWTPVFMQFMHEYLTSLKNKKGRIGLNKEVSKKKELYVGDVIQAAIQDDLYVEVVVFPNGKYFDIGTPGDLQRAVCSMCQPLKDNKED